MKKNKVKYSFLVFIYAYLRQADLSLDRSKYVSLSELVSYYKTHIEPRKVAEYLCRDVNCSKNYEFDSEFSSSFITLLQSRFLVVFKRQAFLSLDERCYCQGKLLELDKILSGDEVDRFEVEKLRNEIATFNYEIIEPRLKKSDIKKAESVEHFMQSDFVQTRSLSDFINFRI